MGEGAAKPRVLVIDDSRMVRASITRHIRENYEFREEADGDAGWQTLLLDPAIEVVISDLSMPRLDGYGLLERIRTSKIARIRGVPVIMISGDEDEEARVRARSLGATDFITKGIGTTELLTRLESAIQAARLKRELDDSRNAFTRAKPVDPRLGVVSKEFLYSHGNQLLGLARRQLAEVSVMVIEIDGFAELTSRHGAQVAALVTRKLAKILAARVRKDDSVAQLEGNRFCIVSPSVNVEVYGAFAQRLRSAIQAIALSYRGEIIRISLTIGLANSKSDGAENIEDLIRAAAGRAVQGAVSGGNRVVGAGGELAPAPEVEMSVDRALVLVREDAFELVREHLSTLVQRLLPLLHLIEREYRVGMPITALERRAGLPDARAAEPERASAPTD
ncbi:MAG: diguanylate cyclase [Rhodocyclaceae bacterium]